MATPPPPPLSYSSFILHPFPLPASSYPPSMPRALTLLLLPLLLLSACSSEGPHFPRPDIRAARVTLPADPTADAQVELLARNATDAPLWIKRLDITLAADGADIATGAWDGSRLIDPGTTVLLDIALPLVGGAILPAADTTGDLTVNAHYARSGIIGLMGGESHTYELAIPIRIAK